LVELAPALQATISPNLLPLQLSPFVTIFNGKIVSNSQIKSVPLEKPLSAYRKAASLNPSDLWTWIILARLEPQFKDAVSDLTQAKAIARASNDLYALTFVKRKLGQLLFKYRQEGVWRAFQEAIQVALLESSKQPTNLAWKQDLANGYSVLGIHFIGYNADLNIRNDALKALEQATVIYKELAVNKPDNQQTQLQWAVSHARLANALAGVRQK
jgi:hypothetical protein